MEGNDEVNSISAPDRDFGPVLKFAKQILGNPQSRDKKLKLLCAMLRDQVDYYDWVGFYFTDPENERGLVLGPYVGEPTEHTRIPFGQGICGQAADREETFVVQDVTKESNYLSCSIHVRSEIVVPIFKDGRVMGEIDIDSHVTDPFTVVDEEFLGRLAEMVGEIL